MAIFTEDQRVALEAAAGKIPKGWTSRGGRYTKAYGPNNLDAEVTRQGKQMVVRVTLSDDSRARRAFAKAMDDYETSDNAKDERAIAQSKFPWPNAVDIPMYLRTIDDDVANYLRRA